ncbi:MAG: DUF4411 family protein [Thermomicrobiales bacterium]|nr:DUF4411 family protein [Thermomicrobiales bacterium]
MKKRIYCLDTSVIINMHRDFKIERFPGLWGKLDDLIEDGRLFIHRQVYEELQAKGTESCLRWKNSLPKRCVIEMDGFQGAIVGQITSDHAYLRSYYVQPENKNKADLFLVAIGKLNHWCVVSDEGKKEWKIPDICKKYNVECLDKWGLMEAEDWTF